MNIEEKERLEREFWKNSVHEGPRSDSLENILNKAAEARIFLEKLSTFYKYFEKADRILELGAGQCWASCIVKRKFPKKTVVATDISHAALMSIVKWEYIFRTRINGVIACRAYETPFSPQSFDLVFAYASAHHFVRHRRALIEVSRLLVPHGSALYLHEPCCPEYIHWLARWRVNAVRPEVPEDVLRFRHLRRLAEEAGLSAKTYLAPTLTNRQPASILYYSVIKRLPILSQTLPCSMDFVFHKSA